MHLQFTEEAIEDILKGKGLAERLLLFAFGIRHRYFDDRTFNNGVITVKLFPDQTSIKVTGIRHPHCLVADQPFLGIPRNIALSLLSELRSLDIQIIITASLLIDTSKLPRDTHIISTSSGMNK